MFKYIKEPNIADLSWCSILEKDVKYIKVIHGEGIETFKNFFVEGVWDDSFELGNFEKSTFFMGSGGKIVSEEETKIMFSTTSHTLERLYSIKHIDKTYISNSLPLILKTSKIKVDIQYRKYESDFNTILKGINEYKKYIHLEKNLKLNLHYYCNILISDSCEIEIIDKPSVEPFINYDDYKKRLLKSTKQLVTNANSSFRKRTYGLVTTISKGYDAPACAALSKELGCDTALTFDKPAHYQLDSGEDIAKKLGYKKIIKKNANDYLENNSLLETEFLSSGELGSGIIFTAFEKEFKHNLVFMGLRGDNIWAKKQSNINNEFRFDDEVFTDSSMVENRLRVGYSIIPVPLFGASQWKSIHNISTSKEMEKYSVGGNYDRPIPRRMLEEKGISRNMFGMKKTGAGFNYRYDNLNRVKKRMSPHSFESFQTFYKSNKTYNVSTLKYMSRYLWSSRKQYINYALNKSNLKYRLYDEQNDDISNPGAPSYLFPWAISATMSILGEKLNNNHLI